MNHYRIQTFFIYYVLSVGVFALFFGFFLVCTMCQYFKETRNSSEKHRERLSFKSAMLFHFTHRIKPPHLRNRLHDCLHKSNKVAATNLYRHKHSNSKKAAELTYVKTQRNLERNGGNPLRAGAAH